MHRKFIGQIKRISNPIHLSFDFTKIEQPDLFVDVHPDSVLGNNIIVTTKSAECKPF